MLTLINLIFTTAVIIVLVSLTLHYFQAANEPGTETPPVSAYLKAWLGESVSITLAIMLVPISWLSRTFQKTGHSQGPAVAVVSTSLLGSPAPCLMLQWSLWRAGLTNVHAIALPHARGSLDKMATSLKQQLAALAQQAGRGQPLTVLAHGSAGLVLRNILESPELPQLGRVLTLGCPHQGTMSAVFFRPQTSLQLRPGSGFLASLPEPPAHNSCPLTDLVSPPGSLPP